MNRPVKITTAMAASIMGKSDLFVREGMRRGELPIGTAMQLPESTRWNFFISPPMLAEYLGIELADLCQMVNELKGEKTA